MKSVKFTIQGNQEDSNGNPIPCVRMTQGSKWSRQAMRYTMWKGFVQGFHYRAVTDENERREMNLNFLDKGKPIRVGKKQKVRMDIMIFWANDAHADPDNIYKGIADALFINDKNVYGMKDFCDADDKKGRVEVSITFE